MRSFARVLPLALLGLLVIGSVAREADAETRGTFGDVVERGDPGLVQRGALLTWGGRPFTGYLVEHHGPRIVARTRYLDGLEHGVAEAWYPSGALRFRRFTWLGLREGTHRQFWESGRLRTIATYRHDLLEGEQAAYFADGKLAELRHWREGREEGRQSLWDHDGTLIANYTFKEGRRYGIVGRFDCVSMVER